MRADWARILCLAPFLVGGCGSDLVWLYLDVDSGNLGQETLDGIQSMKVDLIAVPVQIGPETVDAVAVCEGLESGELRPDERDLGPATLSGSEDEYAGPMGCLRASDVASSGAPAVWALNPDRIQIGAPYVDGGQDVDVVVYSRAFDGDSCGGLVVASACKGFPLFPGRENILTVELAAVDAAVED
jgi:hypothetical protein